MSRGMYICEYVLSFLLLAACNMYTKTRARARVRVVPSFGLLVFGIFPRRVQEMSEHLLSLLSRQAPGSLVSTAVALCTFVYLCTCFNLSCELWMRTSVLFVVLVVKEMIVVHSFACKCKMFNIR